MYTFPIAKGGVSWRTSCNGCNSPSFLFAFYGYDQSKANKKRSETTARVLHSANKRVNMFVEYLYYKYPLYHDTDTTVLIEEIRFLSKLSVPLDRMIGLYVLKEKKPSL
ncbi:hypothetical protein CYY_003128 [Polysphondylium violaceum]|uniref:Uncharacterized protein n=1 Tax=Polysphondylium violaceum TaxID=133409 RepID=A0A8J4V0F3_9MYCE|nr:hypothetical protein CYY_003128 [Polysphondylium violaceum]